MTGEKEFYNIARDRDELNSLHNDVGLTTMRTNLAARLARLRGCSGATCRRGPQIGLRSRLQNRRLGCRRSRVFLRVGGPSSGRIVQTAFYIDGHLLKRDRRRPFTVTVPKRFAKPDGSLLEALTTLTDSRRQTVSRSVAGCS